MVYFLEELTRRTEFSVLQKLTECAPVSVNSLNCSGSLIIPGFAYKKLPDDAKARINRWLGTAANHLLLTPSWTAVDLTALLDLPVPVAVVKHETLAYEAITVSHVIESAAKERLYRSGSNVLGVRLRKNTASGGISILTIPVLDYAQTQHLDTFKEILNEVLSKHAVEAPEKEAEPTQFTLSPTHLHLLMLCAAGVDIAADTADAMTRYFDCRFSNAQLRANINELRAAGLLTERALTDAGRQLLAERRLYAFVKAIKKQEERGNEW